MFYGNIVIWILCFCVSPRDGAIIPMRDREGKLSLVEWTNYNYREPEGIGTYAFGYDIEDQETNNVQFRNEEKLRNGSVVGSYGYLEPNGDVFLVNYIADERGYRASFEHPLKLSFLRPQGSNNPEQKEGTEKVGTSSSIRIVTPDEGTPQQSSNNNHANQQLNHEEFNSVHYQQNIFGSAGFNQNNMNEAGVNGNPSPKPQQSFSNFNSEKESNAFYYPQNILQSPDFNKPGNLNNQLIFQKKS